MIYLEEFSILTPEQEERWLHDNYNLHCTRQYYPFRVFETPLPQLKLGNITILYGGNGSGKTTLLNLMAEKLRLPRSTPYNRTPFFGDYVEMCSIRMAGEDTGYVEQIPYESRFIGSDDVFEHILRLREQNDARNLAAERAARQWGEDRSCLMRLNSQEQGGYDAYLAHMKARHTTRNRYISQRAEAAEREYSNGESAFIYFTQAIAERGLYLLDEPENSLSPNLQLDLVDFLSSSVVCGAQLVIATHSPLLLSIEGAVIYDLDHRPITTRPWYELENVRLLFHFFNEHRGLFLNECP